MIYLLDDEVDVRCEIETAHTRTKRYLCVPVGFLACSAFKQMFVDMIIGDRRSYIVPVHPGPAWVAFATVQLQKVAT